MYAGLPFIAPHLQPNSRHSRALEILAEVDAHCRRTLGSREYCRRGAFIYTDEAMRGFVNTWLNLLAQAESNRQTLLRHWRNPPPTARAKWEDQLHAYLMSICTCPYREPVMTTRNVREGDKDDWQGFSGTPGLTQAEGYQAAEYGASAYQDVTEEVIG